MSIVSPFRDLRPTPESASRVAAVPYDVVNREEAAALVAGNPLSFLHVSRAEIDLPASTNPYSDAVYQAAVRNFEALKRDAPLVMEDEPSLYLYRLRRGSHEQVGVAACYSLDEYDTDLIKKHERTRPDKEDDRTRHMLAIHAQTGPVFLTYRKAADIDAIAARVMATPPLFDVEAPDGVRHTLWRAGASDTAGLVRAFARVPALYIADGHHRAASAARARRQLRAERNGASGEHDTVLAVAFPHDQMLVLPYNRVVRDLAGRDAKAFLAELSKAVPVDPGPPAPDRKGHVSMFLEGTWYRLDFGRLAGAAGDRISALDVSLLQDHVLAPILGVADPRTDKRVDFVGGARGTAELERRVRAGAAAVAFSMFPVTVDDLMAISDQGGIMPPKSTWFEPKLRDGFLSHLI